MVLLFTVTFWVVVPLTRIPRKPAVVPVPPLLIVIVPMLLLLMTSRFWKLKSKMPWKPMVFAVADDALTTMLDEPSRLPIVLPVMLNKPAVDPTEMPVKTAVVLDPVALDVWLMPEIMFPWMLVVVVVLVLEALIPLTWFVEPLMVVVP